MQLKIIGLLWELKQFDKGYPHPTNNGLQQSVTEVTAHSMGLLEEFLDYAYDSVQDCKNHADGALKT